MQQNGWTRTLSAAESRTQLAIWSIMAAPLIMSNDLRNMSGAAREVLLNREVIAVDQDAAGRQGWRVTGKETLQVWARPLSGEEWAVGLLNEGGTAANITAVFSEFGGKESYHVRDLWSHVELGVFNGSLTAVEVAPHDTKLYRLW